MKWRKPIERKTTPEVQLTAEQRRLVDDHLPLVNAPARKLASRAIPEDDRRQDGALGLIDAARSWNPDAGVSFHRYAAKRVAGEMIDAERNGEGVTIYVPRTAWERMDDNEKFAAQPVRGLGLTTEREHGEHRGVGMLDMAEDRRLPTAEPTIDAEAVRLALDWIGGRYAELLRLRYWDGLTMREVGMRLGLSESRASQLHAELIPILREHPLILMAMEPER